MRPTMLTLMIFLLTACGGSGETDDAPGSSALPLGESVQLVTVLDGDSFIARRADGGEAEVRLLGINAPEADECLGNDARAALQQLLDEESIRLTVGNENTDQFGRLLRYVATSRADVNLTQLEAGLAIAVQTGHERETAFLEAADGAAAAGEGLWAPDACGPPPPTVAIVDYVYNPPGPDEDDINNEWVTLTNQAADPIDLSGWTIRDESTQNRFRFPAGVVLSPEEEVLVRSGCGDDEGGRVFYWCAPTPVWSNGGDTILLLDENGTIVTWERYRGDF